VACSEELQVALINEINKLYREIGRCKQAVEEELAKKEQVTAEGRVLRSRVEMLEREHKLAKEML
jgi:regulator of replication initiation timing